MTTPAMSVILLAPTDLNHIQKTIRHLRAQTRASELELLIVTPHTAALSSAAATWREFHSVRLLPIPHLDAPGAGRLLAFESASAPLLAFAEDHAFPSPNWADALIRAFDDDNAAVGVEMRNANPSPVSRADVLMNFAPWVAPARRGTYPMLPGHNSSYRRETLVAYGDDLLAMLNSEAVMHQDLTRRGKTLFLETSAYVAHINLSRVGPFLHHKWLGGRIFAGLRAQTNHWSLPKRILYGLGAPLVPFVRFARLIPDLKRIGAFAPFEIDTIFYLALGLIVHAGGELVGYWFGPGDAFQSYARLELYREAQILSAERRIAFE